MSEEKGKKKQKKQKKQKNEKTTKKAKKIKEIGKKIISLIFEETARDPKEEIKIEYKNCADYKGKEFIEKQFPKLFSREQYELLEGDSLFLYYRGVKSITRISDPDYEYDDEELKERDPLGKVVGCFYLLSNKEKDCLKHEKRRSPTEYDIILRMAYINFDLIGIINGNIAFFVQSILLDTSKRLKDKSLQQTRIKALAFMTHLAIDQDQSLRDKIGDQQLDLRKKDKQLDEKRDKELIGMLHNGEIDNILKRNFEFEKANLTTILSSIICFILGILITLAFVKKGG